MSAGILIEEYYDITECFEEYREATLIDHAIDLRWNQRGTLRLGTWLRSALWEFDAGDPGEVHQEIVA